MQQLFIVIVAAGIICFFAFYGFAQRGKEGAGLKRIRFYRLGESKSVPADSALGTRFLKEFTQCIAAQKPQTLDRRVNEDLFERLRAEKTCAELEYGPGAQSLHFLGEIGNPEYLRPGYDRLFLCLEEGLLYISFDQTYRDDPLLLRELHPLFSFLTEENAN